MMIVATTLACFGQNAAVPHDISGTYRFLHDGEELQINIEPERVSGHINSHGLSDSDQELLLGYFFEKAQWDGEHLAFTTRMVHGARYSFDGVVQRGSAKRPADEGYLQVVGKLSVVRTDDAYRASTQEREVSLPSSPQGLTGDWAPKSSD